MKSMLSILVFLFAFTLSSKGQSKQEEPSHPPMWTEADRTYLLENLKRSKAELLEETQNLSQERWNFKEDQDRWSINQIVEHLAIYELIFLNDISVALQVGEFPQIKKYAPDSLFVDQDPVGLNQNVTTDYTKPFSYTVPLGNNEGADNLKWLTKMHDEAIEFVQSETRNLRIYYIDFGPNIHQKCMRMSSHIDRHLRQIKKVKSHPNYPQS